MELPPPAATIRIPATAPVIVLPECNLLPHGLLPLFIFESRYREMLEDALTGNRLFCIGMLKPSSEDDREAGQEIFPRSTIGLIRASVAHEDGTSHLVLQGLQRVQFLEWIKDRPYPQARIAPVESVNSDPVEAQSLALRLLEIAGKLIENGIEVSAQLQGHLSLVEDPDTIADIVAANFIRDPHLRQKVIETPEICERLRIVISELRS